jgi:hypothetical protein
VLNDLKKNEHFLKKDNDLSNPGAFSFSVTENLEQMVSEERPQTGVLYHYTPLKGRDNRT